MKIQDLPQHIIHQFPTRLQQCIHAVLEEEDAYAADELVELAEEILAQLAAIGLAAYLSQARQKPAFNDYIITLFLSSRHQNAGAIFRWVSNMIKDAEGQQCHSLHSFFWQKDEDGEVRLNAAFNHLSELRNAVMHGFFVLPPDRNAEEAKNMAVLLKKMIDAKLFENRTENFHFCNEDGFTGSWHIESSHEWLQYEGCGDFGALAKRTVYENSDAFLKDERSFALESTKVHKEVAQAVTKFLQEKDRGALGITHVPEVTQGDELYRSAMQAVDTDRFAPVCFRLNEAGIAYAGGFLQQTLSSTIAEMLGEQPKWLKKDWLLKERELEKHTAKIAQLPKRLVVVVGAIHTAMFSSEHMLHLVNQLYTAGIPLIAIGWHHPHLSRYFNASFHSMEGKGRIDNQAMLDAVILNYLRFKEGAHAEQKQALKEHIDTLKQLLNDGRKVVALRYANENKLNTELVHEALAVLAPFYHTQGLKFEKDELHPLFKFPEEYTESSHVFLHLGRRDATLDYQHNVLSN